MIDRSGFQFRWVVVGYLIGVLLAGIAVLPEVLSGSAPGFGPMQISAVIASGCLLVLTTCVLARADRKLLRGELRAAGLRIGKLAAKLLVCIGSLVVVAIAAEGWARWRAKPPDDQRRWLELIKDLPEADQLAKDRGDWNNFKDLEYHDYYLYGIRPRMLATSTFTPFFGDRPCPSSVADSEARRRVWFFGGSTMMNLETTDERTIANNAIKRLNESGLDAVGHNFGMGTFQSCLELNKFQEILRRVPPSERPTIVVFYDGFNDANCGFHFGAGRMQSDISGRLRMLIEHRHWDMVRVGVVEGLLEDSRFYQDYGRWLATQRASLAGVRNDASVENLDQTVAVYLDNIAMTRGICREFGIRPLFALQPLIVTKQGRTSDEDEIYQSLTAGGLAGFVESFYAKAREALVDRVDYVDLSHVLDHDGRTDFYDLGHTGPYTGANIGSALGDAICERETVARRSRQSGD